MKFKEDTTNYKMLLSTKKCITVQVMGGTGWNGVFRGKVWGAF